MKDSRIKELEKISENIADIDGERYFKEDSRGWLDVPELGRSFEIEVHDKNKSWDDLGLKDREAELPTMEECKFLANTPKYAKILEMDGSSIGILTRLNFWGECC